MKSPESLHRHVVILGCGTSTGVPLLVCDCAVCRSSNPKNQRTRASISLEWGEQRILIDTSTDLRFQALRENIRRVDAVIYTHPHADHISGIDELRSFCFAQKSRIPVFGNPWTHDEFLVKFSYIFKPTRVEGGGIPQLDFHRIDDTCESQEILGETIHWIRAPHGSQTVLGVRWRDMAYLTDCHEIPKTEFPKLRGLQTLIIDALRFRKHPTHLHLDQTLAYLQELAPETAYLTHMGHDFDYESPPTLPPNVHLAFDGLRIKIR